MIWTALAFGAPVVDAVRIYTRDPTTTCIERTDGTHACWGGTLPIATTTPAPADDAGCRLADGQVRCTGADWRWHAGMPPETPVDEPVHVPVHDGVDDVAADGRCALRNGQMSCLHLGEPVSIPFPASANDSRLTRLVTPACAVDTDEALWCADVLSMHVRKAPLRRVHAGPVAEARVLGGRVLVRKPDGTVWMGGEQLAIPPSPPTGETLMLRQTHGCAITEGRVACFGAPWNHALGAGTPRLSWVGCAGADGDPPMPCRLEDGSIRCSPWGGALFASAMPPLALDGMVALEVGPHFGCGLTGAGALHCFGQEGPRIRLVPDEPMLEGVKAFDVNWGIVALTEDGGVHHWMPGMQAMERSMTLEDATEVVTAEVTACAIAPETMRCVDADLGVFEVDRPTGEVKARLDTLQTDGPRRCLEDVGLMTPSADASTVPRFVEAAW
jgi:hypothetical protein